MTKEPTLKLTGINWELTTPDAILIERIVERYSDIAEERQDEDYDPLNLLMDLTACHSNGTPLDLEKLLKAPRFDFVHDLAGITHHIDRNTGKLTGCFVPRCSA